MRDVDNEGYHVAKATRACRIYTAKPTRRTISMASAAQKINDRPPLWSVRAYRALVSHFTHLPEPLNASWLYLGIFPNAVIGLYPDSIIFYQEVPVGTKHTLQRGAVYRHREETRTMRAARYLSGRIDGLTADEDLQLTRWTDEAPPLRRL